MFLMTAAAFLAVNATAKTLRVAGLYSTPTLSYSIDSYGQEMSCITRARIEEARREGLRIDYEQIDTRRDPMTIAQAVQNIVDEKKFDAVVGTIVSAESVTASKILGKGGIPFISPTGTHPDITKNNPFALRIPFSDYRQAGLLATLTVSELKPQRIVVVRNVSNVYSVFLSKQYADEIARLAPSVQVTTHSILDDFQDFEGLSQKIVGNSADLVFAPTWEPQVASLYAKLATKNRKFILLTSDTIDGRAEFIKLLGPLSPNIRFVFSNYWNNKLSGPYADSYRRIHRKYCGSYPMSRVSVAAFDAINLVVEAAKRGAYTNHGEFVSRMKALKMQGLTGALYFDDANDAEKPLHLFEVKGPAPTYWKEYGG
jgi:branched-chain amino acid transport system substrate-binding protein